MAAGSGGRGGIDRRQQEVVWGGRGLPEALGGQSKPLREILILLRCSITKRCRISRYVLSFFSTTNCCSLDCSPTKRYVIIYPRSSSCGWNQTGPFISPLQEVAIRCPRSRRGTSFGTNFEGLVWSLSGLF